MTNLLFTTGIPATNNNPSDDQPPMRVNNDNIYAWVGGDSAADHYGFNVNDGALHKRSSYVAQGSDPGSVSGRYVQYGKDSSGSTELFAQKDGVATPIQLTRGVPLATSSGYSYLPGGLLIQWFSVNFGVSLSGTFSFPTPFTSSVLSVVGNQSSVSTGNTFSVGVGNTTTTQVTLWRSSATGANTAFVIAIGV